MEIRNIKLLKEVYKYGRYTVYTGYVDRKEDNDIPHYLIVNTEHEVVETSSPYLSDARALAYAMEVNVGTQDKQIESKEPLSKENPRDSFRIRAN